MIPNPSAIVVDGEGSVTASRTAAPSRAFPAVVGFVDCHCRQDSLRAALRTRLRTSMASLRARVDVHDALYGVCAAGEPLLSLCDDDATVVIFGRPTWRGARGGSDLARLILDAYRTDGLSVLQALGGAFGLVLVDGRGRDVLLAIDRTGVMSLTYARCAGGVVFGTSASDVAACLPARPAIDAQSIFNYVFLHFVPGPTTIFEGLRRLPPGGYLRCRDGVVEAARYWEAHYDEDDDRPEAQLEQEFRGLLERSIREAMSVGNVGAFMSGGTDSSTIAGLMTKLRGAPARTYSIGFDAKGYDEMSYARIAARHFGTNHHEYYVTPEDVRTLAPRVAAVCDQPFGNASAVPTYYCAALARADGVDVMLGGDGGDELFGGNERYAMQAMLSWYAKIPAPLRSAIVEPLLFGLPGGERIAPVRMVRGYVQQARLSVPERLHHYNMLRRDSPADVFTRDFLASVDTGAALAMLCTTYEGAHARSQLNRMLALDLQYTLADNDLYKVNRMCELAGVEVGYPMLDDDLVTFSLRLPSRHKLRGRRLRYLFKRALRGFLPPEIIAKRKHGFGLPVGIWMQSHAGLRDLLYDGIRGLAARGVLDARFVDRVIAEHRGGHAAYWGGEIWVLSQLEFWLVQHGFGGRSPLA